jgi:hypothetical protein
LFGFCVSSFSFQDSRPKFFLGFFYLARLNPVNLSSNSGPMDSVVDTHKFCRRQKVGPRERLRCSLLMIAVLRAIMLVMVARAMPGELEGQHRGHQEQQEGGEQSDEPVVGIGEVITRIELIPKPSHLIFARVAAVVMRRVSLVRIHSSDGHRNRSRSIVAVPLLLAPVSRVSMFTGKGCGK